MPTGMRPASFAASLGMARCVERAGFFSSVMPREKRPKLPTPPIVPGGRVGAPPPPSSVLVCMCVCAQGDGGESVVFL